jgi:hypothetical protein
MGIGTSMKCPCGYSADILIGSGMSGDVLFLPHCCDACGVVDVDLLQNIPSCPSCSSTRIMMYGEVRSNDDRLSVNINVPETGNEFWLHDARATQPKGDILESWNNWRIAAEQHFCPKCSRMSLRVACDYLMRWD